jgi:hypothetical protein
MVRCPSLRLFDGIASTYCCKRANVLVFDVKNAFGVVHVSADDPLH